MNINIKSNNKNLKDRPDSLIAIILLISCFFWLSCNNNPPDKNRIKSKDNKEQLKSYDLLSRKNLLSNPKQAVEYGRKQLKEAIKYNDIQLTAKAYLNIGLGYDYGASFDSALFYYKLALNIFKKFGNEKQLANIYFNIGIVNKYLSNYQESINYFIKSLKLYENYDDKSIISRIYNNIGLVYFELTNYDKALEYYNRALSFKGSGNDSSFASTYLNIGVVYNNLQQYDKAMEYYNKSIEIGKKYNDKVIISRANNNISLFYSSKENWQKAVDYAENALRLKQELGDSSAVITTYNILGDIYLRDNLLLKAESYYNKALLLSRQMKIKRLELYSLQNLSNFYQNTEDFQKAYNYFVNYSLLKDSIFNQQTNLKITELELKYRDEKKEQENKLLKYEKDKQEIYLILIIIIAFLIFMTAIILLVSYKKIKKANKDLTEKNNQIIIQSEKLIEINTAKDKFFSIIAHDLKNPFWAIKEMSEMLYEKITLLEETKIKEIVLLIRNSSKKLFEFLENLLQWSKTQTGQIVYSPVRFDLNKIINKTINLYKDNANSKKIEFEISSSPDTYVFADMNMTSTILNNLVSNAIKFSRHGSKINISTEQNEDKITTKIKDYGTGMTEEQLDNLYKLDNHNIKPGTSNEDGTGLGIIICREFVEINGGKLEIQSILNQGSVFAFDLKSVE